MSVWVKILGALVVLLYLATIVRVGEKLPNYVCAEAYHQLSRAEHRALCGEVESMYPER